MLAIRMLPRSDCPKMLKLLWLKPPFARKPLDPFYITTFALLNNISENLGFLLERALEIFWLIVLA